MIEQVMLPIEVAGDLEELRSERLSNFGIITGMTTDGHGAFNTIMADAGDHFIQGFIRGYRYLKNQMEFRGGNR